MVDIYQHPSDYLHVKFDARHIFKSTSVVDNFIKTIQYIGVEKVRSLKLDYRNKELIAYHELDKKYVEIEKNHWLSIPSTIKPMVKLLILIRNLLKIQMEITYSSQKDNRRYEATRIKNESKLKPRTDLKFKLHQYVYNPKYGQGKILELPVKGFQYKVKFNYIWIDGEKKVSIEKVDEKSLTKLKK